MTRRWLRFAIVGGAGFVVQIAALWTFVAYMYIHYLPATLLATELAIVLNFFCHEWWTWSDRPAGRGEALRRLGRFHMANGAISLAGGAIGMSLLIELAHAPYLVANVITVGICAAANYVAADRLVFTIRLKPDPTSWLNADPTSMRILILIVGLTACSSPAAAADLRSDTLAAFDRYVRITESRMDGELQGTAPFLSIDRLPERDRRERYDRLIRGEIVVEHVTTRDKGRDIDSPHGLIHHWLGTAFLPHAAIDRVLALMQGYDRYEQIYSPNIRRSHTISRRGDSFKVYLQLFMKKVIGVVLNTEYDVRYTRMGASRAHVRSYSTRIAEVQNPGTAAEKEAPPGDDSGFLWRFDNYWSLEERAEGTYIECESLSLSRSIPAGLGWIVGPFVTSIPKESLQFTLTSMRKALS